MLLYTAELKLPRHMSYKDKVRKVSLIINQLALTTCQHVRIGSAIQRGISGERPPSPGPAMKDAPACTHRPCSTALDDAWIRQAARRGR